mgnify:CR=1 FL=1
MGLTQRFDLRGQKLSDRRGHLNEESVQEEFANYLRQGPDYLRARKALEDEGSLYWILDGHTPVNVGMDDYLAFILNNREDDWRRVALDLVDGYRISTVFLALDHDHSGKGPPVLFETMVFLGDSGEDLYCERYHIWDEAEAGHKIAVQWVKDGRPDLST